MIRRAERAGLIPPAHRSRGGFRFWDEADLPDICEGLGVPLPPAPAERVLRDALALLGIEPTLSAEETLRRLQDELAPAVKTILKAPDLAELLTSVQGGID